MYRETAKVVVNLIINGALNLLKELVTNSTSAFALFWGRGVKSEFPRGNSRRAPFTEISPPLPSLKSYPIFRHQSASVPEDFEGDFVGFWRTDKRESKNR
ncbi:hypothetical protein CDAR_117181 [Caerostris darwini]|uniref:Uncharacterized protein n=1 Tax=Caerostris darwini TaxID=1538125 RepID=A0AAV4U559_9ARAC|nr:hypothetical protein CDAR_117181 [Caerostris darwini]